MSKEQESSFGGGGAMSMQPPAFQLKAGPGGTTDNSPLQLQDGESEGIVVGYTGGVTGDGVEVPNWEDSENNSTSAVNDAVAAASDGGLTVQATVISPGFDSGPAVASGLAFIQRHYNAGDTVVIYGYSRGGDCAVELAAALDGLDTPIPVKLLITVDAAFGALGPAVVDRDIPDNVERNINEYQTDHSRIGSRGDANTAISPGDTTVNNHDLSDIEGMSHASIHRSARGYNAGHMQAALGMDVNTAELEFGSTSGVGGSSRSSSESSSDSGSDNSSSSSFNDSDSSSQSDSSNENNSSSY